MPRATPNLSEALASVSSAMRADEKDSKEEEPHTQADEHAPSDGDGNLAIQDADGMPDEDRAATPLENEAVSDLPGDEASKQSTELDEPAASTSEGIDPAQEANDISDDAPFVRKMSNI